MSKRFKKKTLFLVTPVQDVSARGVGGVEPTRSGRERTTVNDRPEFEPTASDWSAEPPAYTVTQLASLVRSFSSDADPRSRRMRTGAALLQAEAICDQTRFVTFCEIDCGLSVRAAHSLMSAHLSLMPRSQPYEIPIARSDSPWPAA